MVQRNLCCGCGACAQQCPASCIEMKEDAEGFLYPVLDNTKCIHCMKCENVCPVEALEQNAKEKKPDAFAVINLNDGERMRSSSGGFFSLLANKILEEEGVVFGAALSDDNKRLSHVMIERKEDLWKLNGSKYFQSIIGDSYICAHNLLEQGRKVLFSGTPCQIEGLLKYIGRPYDNLLCMDLICHGVPSPKAWRKYLNERESLTASKSEWVSFRDKRCSWKNYSVAIRFQNGEMYNSLLDKDSYMISFLNNANLRPSCYSCRYKSVNRKSDITVGDFWGIENVCPEMDDDKGTSLVIIHSSKGQGIFEELKSQTEYCRVDIEEALKNNSAMITSPKPHPRRTEFFNGLDTMPFEKIIEKYLKPRLRLRSIRNKIIRIIRDL